MSNYKFGIRSKKKLYGDGVRPAVKPIVVKVVETALEITTVDFSVIDGTRLDEDQYAAYASGNSELDGINKISDHQLRLAIDVVPVVKHEGVKLNPFDISNIYVRLAWLELYRAFMRAAMIHKVVLEYGFGYNMAAGNNKSRDWPHISFKGYIKEFDT